MNLLILTCSTGGGHNVTAEAIADHFSARGHNCTIIDCLEFLPTLTAKILSEGHIFLYRKAPKLFGIGYRFEENHDTKLIRAQFMSCAKAFTKRAKELGCDATISSHPFAALITTAAKRKCGLDVPNFFVATDYTCCPGVSDTEQDLYFIPHKELTETFVRCGLSRENLIPSGIPVRPAFYQKLPQDQARDRLQLPQTGKLLLLSCGSMGAGPMQTLAVLLDQALAPNDQLAVICGTNEKLLRSLSKKNLSNRVRLLGFTDQIDLYMDAADLILTKPGGISTTEALTKRLPLVYVDAVPGCETRNLEFIVSRGYASTAKTPSQLAELCVGILQDDAKLSAWRTMLEEAFPDCAIDTIYDHVMQHTSLTAAAH